MPVLCGIFIKKYADRANAKLLATRWSMQQDLIEIGNRNTDNIKTAIENANLCGKKYAIRGHC